MPDLPSRKSREADLAAAIMLRWEDFLDTWPNPDWSAFEAATRESLEEQGEETYVAAAAVLFGQVGHGGANLSSEAAAWAKGRADEIAPEITGTTRRRLAEIQENKDQSAADLAAAILLVISLQRIEMIAVTETTAAITAGQQRAADMIETDEGLEFAEIWHTADDDGVCEVCEPLDGTGREIWGLVSPMGPGVHPR